MRSLMILTCAVALTAAVPSFAADPVKTQPKEVVTTPLTGDPSREVKILNVILPPGADSGRHYHHGDQYTTVQEGEIQIDVDGQGAHVLKAGEALHIDPMVWHRTQNLSGQQARTTEFFVIAKGKPLAEREEAAAGSSGQR
jgi:quercetin dioxygenase-like cupin family protein